MNELQNQNSGSSWIGTDSIKREGDIGFIYIIRHRQTLKYYVGKKMLIANKRRKPLKGRKNGRKYQTESDWKDYWGSSKKFQEYVKQEGEDKFTRVILLTCTNKFDLAMEELKQQMRMDVLNDPNSFNEIINVRLRKAKR